VHVDPDLIESLTSREIEVLWLLDTQLSNTEIAAVLRISAGTTERHTSSIYRKLAIHARREAIARTHELRLLSSCAPEGESPP
jgi:ATP/maltotriose-dependent transcriptional regulator MalT